MTATLDNPTKSRSRTMYIVVAAILVALLAGLIWYLFFQTYHQVTVQEGVLYRTGNRGMREFKNTLRKTGAKTVVCLVDANELVDPAKPMFAAEKKHLEQNGIDFVHLPVTLGGFPTTEDVRRFLSIVEDPKNQPVIVHCAQGVRRTGMFVAAFEESVLGHDDATVRANLQTFGHSQRTIKDVQQFIDVYDAKTRTVTADLAPTGKE